MDELKLNPEVWTAVVKPTRIAAAEYAVIEAAKRFVRDPSGVLDPEDHPTAGPRYELIEAVEALEEATQATEEP